MKQVHKNCLTGKSPHLCCTLQLVVLVNFAQIVLESKQIFSPAESSPQKPLMLVERDGYFRNEVKL